MMTSGDITSAIDKLDDAREALATTVRNDLLAMAAARVQDGTFPELLCLDPREARPRPAVSIHGLVMQKWHAHHDGFLIFTPDGLYRVARYHNLPYLPAPSNAIPEPGDAYYRSTEVWLEHGPNIMQRLEQLASLPV